MPLVKKLFLLSALLVCSALAWAQRGPVTAMEASSGGDITGSYSIMVKSADLDIGWKGADVSMTKYVTRHWGVRAEADMQRMDTFDFHEYGFRGGPVYSFRPKAHVQPYMHYLVGYARTKATEMFVGPYVYHSGVSMLGGGGVDYRVKNGWFVRGGADIVANNNSTNGFGSKFARFTIGISRHFADRE
jgi:hypothetical protein